jgi:CO/xanthine dehydrogenase Mo-binding subunit/molybdopterin converting factor small subunit
VRPDGVDKVTGRARYGADLDLPGMLWGRVLRSPHAHARILGIDASGALEMEGVKAVVCADDLPEIGSEQAYVGEGPTDFRDLSRNVMARGKVLYHGHAVAAVAATSAELAERALDRIAVEYEVLPAVLDLGAALAPGAPLLHEDLVTKGVDPPPQRPSNVAERVEMGHGDVDAGLARADVVVEREFTTRPVHQGYIEPHAALAEIGEDGRATIWCSSQGHFMVRAYTAKLLGMELSHIRVIPAEIGGGFGGKTTVYLEPVATLLARKSGRPVKMVMSREEVFRATGPTSGSRIRVKLGCTRDGRLTGADAHLEYEAGAFPGSPVSAGAMTIFAPYDVPDVRVVGIDVVLNTPKTAAYRAPGAPMAAFAAESVVDELARCVDLDPIEFRLRNAAREGVRAPYGPRFKRIGHVETLEAARAHPHYRAPLLPNQGRGVASGFWFNAGLQSSADVHINEDGSAVVTSGNPDIGGSRASLAILAAEELGIDYERVSPIVADTNQVAYSDLTGGSRVTFATGMAVVEAARGVVRQLRERAAAIWGVDVDEVEWQDGEARAPDGGDGPREPLALADLAARAARTGGPIAGHASLTARGVGAAFGTHICDVEVDPETGAARVVRYTAVQDAGCAVHPSYVEGQMQGGVAQGIGWALNEEYIFDADGVMQNPGFSFRRFRPSRTPSTPPPACACAICRSRRRDCSTPSAAERVARVLLSGALRRHAGGRAELSIEAPTYRELVAALEARFPGIAPLIEGRTSLAIDGEIIPDPLLEPIPEESEIHFVPRVAGG